MHTLVAESSSRIKATPLYQVWCVGLVKFVLSTAISFVILLVLLVPFTAR